LTIFFNLLWFKIVQLGHAVLKISKIAIPNTCSLMMSSLPRKPTC